MIPIFAPLKEQFEFDAEEIVWEMASAGVLHESIVATTTFEDGKSRHKPFDGFNEDLFKKTNWVKHYDTSGKLVEGPHTFFMNNLTYVDERSKNQSWNENRTTPLWIQHDKPWQWRDDVPYTKSVIEKLPFEYVTTTRVISLLPHTSGVIHADSGKIMNKEYYANGNGSITINVMSGEGRLYYLDEFNAHHEVPEDKYRFWHFDDSSKHCVPITEGHRLQLRVFGKLNTPYEKLLDLENAVY